VSTDSSHLLFRTGTGRHEARAFMHARHRQGFRVPNVLHEHVVPSVIRSGLHSHPLPPAKAQARRRTPRKAGRIRFPVSIAHVGSHQGDDQGTGLQMVLDGIPAPILVIDQTCHAIMANRAARAPHGGADLAAMGVKCSQLPCGLSTPRTCVDHSCPLRGVWQSGQIRRFEHVHYDVRGERHVLDITATPLFDGNGLVQYVVEYGQDISERQRIEEQLRDGNSLSVDALAREKRISMQLEATTEQLRAATDEAKAAARAKGEFLANMSHEIRTPMNAIVGLVELLQKTGLSDTQRRCVNLIEQSVDSLLRILNDILDLSKIESGRFELDPIDFNLRDSLGDTVRVHAVRAYEKGLEIAAHVRPEVPDILIGDAIRLRQILLNLIGNAVKFTHRGEVVVRVEEQSRTENTSTLHFAVADTGIGIPPEKLGIVFDAFSQADGSTTREYGGTGLGLTITKRLVELMGGRIWAESKPGKGSTFHFTAEFRLSKREPMPNLSRPAMNLKGTRALIVDGDRTTRSILDEMLACAGVQARTAADAETAFSLALQAKAAGDPFPIILVGLSARGDDAHILMPRIRHSPGLASTKILVLSPAGVESFSDDSSMLGVAARLFKPVKQSELLEAITTCLGGQEPVSNQDGKLEQHATDTCTLRPLRILVAEDNPVNQEVIASLLEADGHFVSVVGNGQEVLRLMPQDGRDVFDLIFMDVQMPVMSGLEATRAIRAMEKEIGGHIPIVAMTANAMKGDQEECLRSGMDDYLAKPIKSVAIRAVLKRWTHPPSEPKRLSAPPVESSSRAPSTQAALRDGHEKPIDLDAALDNLGGNRRILDKVLGSLMESVPTLLTNLRSALAASDRERLRFHAHSLKGAAANVCAEPLRLAAEHLEDLVRQGELHTADEAIRKVDHLWNRLRQQIGLER